MLPIEYNPLPRYSRHPPIWFASPHWQGLPEAGLSTVLTRVCG